MENSDSSSLANRSARDYIAALSLLELSSSPRNSNIGFGSQQHMVQDVINVTDAVDDGTKTTLAHVESNSLDDPDVADDNVENCMPLTQRSISDIVSQLTPEQKIQILNDHLKSNGPLTFNSAAIKKENSDVTEFKNFEIRNHSTNSSSGCSSAAKTNLSVSKLTSFNSSLSPLSLNSLPTANLTSTNPVTFPNNLTVNPLTNLNILQLQNIQSATVNQLNILNSPTLTYNLGSLPSNSGPIRISPGNASLRNSVLNSRHLYQNRSSVPTTSNVLPSMMLPNLQPGSLQLNVPRNSSLSKPMFNRQRHYSEGSRTPTRRRGDVKKCRKIYGIDNKQMWCKACIWKKACHRFPNY